MGTTDDSEGKLAHRFAAAREVPLVDIKALRWIEEEKASLDSDFYRSGVRNALMETFSDISRVKTARLYEALAEMARIWPFKRRRNL